MLDCWLVVFALWLLAIYGLDCVVLFCGCVVYYVVAGALIICFLHLLVLYYYLDCLVAVFVWLVVV